MSDAADPSSALPALSSDLVSVRRGALRSVLISFVVEGRLLTVRISHDDARALVEDVSLICDGRDSSPAGSAA